MRFSIPKPGPATLARLRSPLSWLLIQLVLLGTYLGTTGALDYRRVPDTQSYIEVADIDRLSLALAQYRTLGYPLFLELFRGEDGNIHLHRVPTVQWLLYALAVVLFYGGLARASRGRWMAFVAVTPLVYSPILQLVDRVQPDFLASAAVLAAFSGLFLLLERRSWARWLLLGLAVFASYQLRPAGMFLVLLLPLVAGVVEWIRTSRSLEKALRLAGVAALVTVTPLLAFSTLRWFSVGHFGLVSFGGSNAIGMASCFLEPGLIRELPERHQSLARAIRRERSERGFRAMERGDDPRPFFEQYGPNIFSISVMAAKAHLKRDLAQASRAADRPFEGLPPDWPVEVNRRLGGLARQIVWRRPVLFLHWIREALVYGTEQLARWLWIVWPALLLLVSLPLALLRLVAGRALPPPDDAKRVGALLTLVLMACGYFTASLLSVSLVSFPFARYFLSMTLLLPSALVALLFETWRWIGRPSARPTDATSSHSQPRASAV